MNLPAILSAFGIIAYSTLLYTVVSTPQSLHGKDRRLFLGTLIVMVFWQVSALVVSLTREESTAILGYEGMLASISAFGIIYALFIRALLGMEVAGAWGLGGAFLFAATALLVVADRSSFITGVYWNDRMHFYLPVFGFLLPVIVVPYALLLLYVVGLLLWGYRQAKHAFARNHIRYLLIGWCLVVAGALANLAEPLKAYPIDILANLVNAALIAHVIFRYHFFDVRFVIRQSLAYSIPTTIIAIGYFITVFMAERLFRDLAGYQVFAMSLLVAAVTAVLTQPLQTRAQRWIDRLFFRDRYDAQLMLQELSALATSILDIDELAGLLLSRLIATMHVTRASLMLRETGGAGLRLIIQRGGDGPLSPLVFGPEHPLVQWMTARKTPVVCQDLDVNPSFGLLTEQQHEELDKLEMRLCIPLLAQDVLVGVLMLGPKHSGIQYSQDEQLTLVTLSNQVAIALENARLYKEAQEELEQRRRAQAALKESETALQRRTARLELQLAWIRLYNEITRAIAARFDLDSILNVVVHRLEDNFVDLAFVWLADGELFTSGASQILRRTSNPEADLLCQIVMSGEMPELRALRQGNVIYLADLAELDLQGLPGVIQTLHSRSLFAIPLVVANRVFGGIVCGRRTPDAFTCEEREFLADLGEHVALAIHQTQLHQQLESAYIELQQTQRTMMQQERLRVLGEMASGIAHDINNAITPIPLYLGLIEHKQPLTEESVRYLGIIKTAVADVEGTVNRMRQFYRDRDETEFVPVNINAAVQHAIDLTRPQWSDLTHSKGATIHLETDMQNNLPLVMGNEVEIRQAVINVVLNAVDAMPKGGVLTLCTGTMAGPLPQVLLEVRDTGLGMADEIREHAFEPFFSTKGTRGSGLGLAMVYGMVQRHKGRVELESTPGEGTTVRLIFPIHDLVLPEVPSSAAPLLPPLHMLYIDDEVQLREVLREVLENEGHTVALADGGELGLKAFKSARESGNPFDLVITDLGMPYMDGRTVARCIKAEDPKTPVIMLTGWGQTMRAESDCPPGVDLLVSKPLTIEALTEALGLVLSKQPN